MAAFAGKGGASVGLGQAFALVVKALPRAQAAVPGAVDRFVQAFVGGQVIVGRLEAVQVTTVGDAMQQVGGQNGPFGFDGGETHSRNGLHE